MALLAGTALMLTRVVVNEDVIWQGLAVGAIGIIGALPLGAAVVAIRTIAVDGPQGVVGHRLAVLLRIRRLLSRLNFLFGLLILVLTLFAATQGSLTEGGSASTSLVIFAGVAGAAVMAVVYLPAAGALRRRCGRFIDEEFPLDDVDREHLVQAAEERHRLEAILGLHRTTFAELQNGLVVLSPLLASTGIALIPGI